MPTQEMKAPRRVTTLKGLGPRVEFTEIQLHQWKQAQQSEFERWTWFSRQLDRQLHEQPDGRDDDILRWMNDLIARPRMPGRVEQALVALSRRRDDGLAMMALREFAPPPGDERLRRFHQICLVQAGQLDP